MNGVMTVTREYIPEPPMPWMARRMILPVLAGASEGRCVASVSTIQLKHGVCYTARNRKYGEEYHGKQNQEFSPQDIAELSIDDEETLTNPCLSISRCPSFHKHKQQKRGGAELTGIS